MDQRPIDLRSDVVSAPTEAMREAMSRVTAGTFSDESDRKVAELERLGAERFGKEAAIFMPSTTMANLIASMCHCLPGEQVIVDEDAHTYRNEVSGLARVAGLLPRVVPRNGAVPDRTAIERILSHRARGETRIRLLWVENTHNVGGGAVAGLDDLMHLRTLAQEHGLNVHCDGARIFNAASAQGVSPSDLVSGVDSISVSFNKALGCPMGSLLVGSAALVDAARPLRRMLGGLVPKAGMVAATCVVALYTMTDRVSEDHATARRLAEAIEETDLLRLESPVVTNILRIETSGLGPAQRLVDALAAENVLVGAVGATVIRAVTHHEITPEVTERVIRAIQNAAARARG